MNMPVFFVLVFVTVFVGVELDGKLYHAVDPVKTNQAVGCKDVASYLTIVHRQSDVFKATSANTRNTDLRICAVEAKSSPCCSPESQNVLHHLASNITHDALRSVVQPQVELLCSSIANLLDKYDILVRVAENLTRDLLSEMYHLNQADWRDCLHALFIDISAGLHGAPGINLHDSIYRFYDSLFPIVFQNILSDPSTTILSADYRDCLMDARADLNPRPFGEIPSQLGARLVQSVHSARSTVHVLATGASILGRASQWVQTDECLLASARLSPCAMCYGIMNARPCPDFCRDVMHGCFHGIGDIDELWNQFIGELVMLIRGGAPDHFVELESVMADIRFNISESIMHSMEITHKYYQQLVARCGRPSPTSQSRSVPFAPSKLQTNLSASVERQPTIRTGLNLQLENLEALKNLFGRLPDALCTGETYAVSHIENCWNGSDLAAYKGNKVDAQRFNSTKSATVRIISSELTAALKLFVRTHNSDAAAPLDAYDAEMQGDSPYYGSGGGQVRRDNSEPWAQYDDGDDDDDDDDDLSGMGRMGSGDGVYYSNKPTQHPAPKPKQNKKKTNDFGFEDLTTRRVAPPYQATWSPPTPANQQKPRTGAATWHLSAPYIVTAALLLTQLLLAIAC